MLRSLSLFTLSFMLSSCAFGTRNVHLAYQPTTQAPADSKGSIAVAPFSDGRSAELSVGSQVGQVRNGYGAPTAAVRAIQSPVVWVADSLARGLAAQGYRVDRLPQASDSSPLPTVSGTVKQVWVDGYMPLESEVVADVVVSQQGRTTFSTQCTGRDTTFPWTSSAEEFQTVLTGSMAQFVNSCVSLLIPYLGAKP